MKLCQKINCNNFSIPRGKYCEIHRIKKKTNNLNIINTNINFNTNLENQEVKENTSEILKKQNEDYNFFMQEDIKRICELNEEKELNNILELSKQTFINDIKNKILEEPKSLKNIYNVKFKLSSGLTLQRKFPDNTKFIDLRNFLNYYFYENKINIINYNLVLFPNKLFTIENNDDLLYKYDIQNTITFYIQDCDS